MKKYIYLLTVFTAILMTGCSQRTKMTDFIPTPTPTMEQESNDASEGNTGTDETADVTPTSKPIDLSKTTVKYVKLDEYGATLNIRKTPSTDSEKVGYLVHTEKVNVVEIKDGWASIVVEGQICYVKAEYLVDERPAYLDPPTVTPTPEPTPTPEVKNDTTTTEDNNAATDENQNNTTDPNAPPEV